MQYGHADFFVSFLKSTWWGRGNRAFKINASPTNISENKTPTLHSSPVAMIDFKIKLKLVILVWLSRMQTRDFSVTGAWLSHMTGACSRPSFHLWNKPLYTAKHKYCERDTTLNPVRFIYLWVFFRIQPINGRYFDSSTGTRQVSDWEVWH